MNHFIMTPFNSYVFVALLFAVLLAAAYLLSKVQKAFVKRLTPTKTSFAIFGVALVLMFVVFGGAVSGLAMVNNHNFEWTQTQIKEKHGLELSNNYDEKPVFDFLDDHERKVWNVNVLDTRENVYPMELRFDPKSNEPIISSPDLFGVPAA